MNDSNKKIYDNRLEKLKNLITKEFPPIRFGIIFKQNDIISVAILPPKAEKKRVPRIEFSATEEFMTDLDSNVGEVFQQGIHLARKILNDPPMTNRILQGQILLTHKGAIFNKRKI